MLREDIENLQASTKSLMPEGFEKQVKPEETREPAGIPHAARASSCRCRSTRSPPIVSTRGMFFDENADSRAAGLRRLVARRRSKACRSCWSIRKDGKRANAILLYGPEGQAAADDAQVGDAAVQHARPRRSTCSPASAAGAFPTASEKTRQHDRAAALRRRPDRGPQAAERRALRRLHPPRRCARQSKFAFDLRGQQLRYLAVIAAAGRADRPRSSSSKADDRTAPVVMAVTVETSSHP